jgi:hypothetical protein
VANLAKILYVPFPNRGRSHGSPDADTDAGRSERHARWVLLALIVGALGLFWAGVRLSYREETAGLHQLSSQARQSLYARTLDEVSTICQQEAAASGSLRDHCVEQARFLMQLPECNDACQRAAALTLPHARR